MQSWCHRGSVHHYFLPFCRHFVAMSLDNEEEGDEGNEEVKEEEERSSGSDGGEAATTVKARRVAGTEPAAKKLKLRRSNRKRGTKPVDGA